MRSRLASRTSRRRAAPASSHRGVRRRDRRTGEGRRCGARVDQRTLNAELAADEPQRLPDALHRDSMHSTHRSQHESLDQVRERKRQRRTLRGLEKGRMLAIAARPQPQRRTRKTDKLRRAHCRVRGQLLRRLSVSEVSDVGHGRILAQATHISFRRRVDSGRLLWRRSCWRASARRTQSDLAHYSKHLTEMSYGPTSLMRPSHRRAGASWRRTTTSDPRCESFQREAGLLRPAMHARRPASAGRGLPFC